MKLITLSRLNRATYDVSGQLQDLGFWNERLESITVWLVPFSVTAYGWQYYRGNGDICIPRVSLTRIGERVMRRPRVALRDVLRHEYAHGLADTHRGLVRSRRFSDAFGAPHDGSTSLAYDPAHHVTPYAARHPSEDFAEVFMFWAKHGGRLPHGFDTPGIRRKWSFVEALQGAMRRGQRRW